MIDGTKVLLTMLAEIPDDENIQKLMTYVKPPEELFVNKKMSMYIAPMVMDEVNCRIYLLRTNLKYERQLETGKPSTNFVS